MRLAVCNDDRSISRSLLPSASEHTSAVFSSHYAHLGQSHLKDSTICRLRGVGAQSCPTPCDSLECSPPGSSVCGVLQARILEWVANSF